ncbi:MAG: helix-hairpin-helix domain-containing protein, partial [Ignavibacteria bacterium]|nr:helix-hairpin-helix domain-containing protein [Ignavibacteria bacterium]
MKLSDALNILDDISFYLELKGENVFKINAFNSAIRNLSQLNIDLSEGLAKGIIQNTKGVGKSILSILKEINEKGTTHVLTELQKEFPERILELTKIHGLGPKKIKKLYENLNISSLGELEYACKENRLVSIEGFGIKSQNKILESIQKINSYRGYLLLHKAKAFAQQIENEIAQKFSKVKISITGELRRSCEIISKIEFVVISDSNFIKKIKTNENIITTHDNYVELMRDDIRIVFHFAEEENYYLRLFETTGPQKFVEKFQQKIKRNAKFSSESEIFHSLEIPFIHPQLRDNDDVSIDDYKLIEMSDIKGLLHFHTNYSDGSNSIQEMLQYAEKICLE